MASAVVDVPVEEPRWMTDGHPVVVIGTGPAGIHVVNEILRWNPETPIVIYGGEPWTPYDRVKLSSLLSGEVQTRHLENQLQLPNCHRVHQWHNCPIVSINRHDSSVTDVIGRAQNFSKLVIATGSHAHIPSIPGIDREGVFTFRDMADAQILLARQMRSRRTLVLGGGVLGLEVAKAMQRANTEVYIIEHSTRLMYNQLDEKGAELLREEVLKLGIKIVLDNGVKVIYGEESVQGVSLRNGRHIDCDTLIVATGVRANSSLALKAGIKVGKGIRVNDFMQTSVPNIYAVGECCEHRGNVYGLVAPGLEQAGVAAHNIAQIKEAKYTGSLSLTRLKVVGCPVFSVGIVEDLERAGVHHTVVFYDVSRGVYSKLTFLHRTLVGVVAVGDTSDATLLSHAIESKKSFWPWELRRFQRTGSLWPQGQSNSVNKWPANAVVCACKGVTREQLSIAISKGSDSVDALSQATGASSVCGSCRPLLAEMCGGPGATESKISPMAIITGIASMLLLLTISLTNPFDAYLQASMWVFNKLWVESGWKQVSGYVLVGLSVSGMLLSMRKRWARVSKGEFSTWKNLHLISGVGILAVLLVHTGAHFGGYLNTALVISFLGASLLGVASSVITGMGSGVSEMLQRQWRVALNFGHVILLWPAPVLITLHILTVYYF